MRKGFKSPNVQKLHSKVLRNSFRNHSVLKIMDHQYFISQMFNYLTSRADSITPDTRQKIINYLQQQCTLSLLNYETAIRFNSFPGNYSHSTTPLSSAGERSEGDVSEHEAEAVELPGPSNMPTAAQNIVPENQAPNVSTSAVSPSFLDHVFETILDLTSIENVPENRRPHVVNSWIIFRNSLLETLAAMFLVPGSIIEAWKVPPAGNAQAQEDGV